MNFLKTFLLLGLASFATSKIQLSSPIKALYIDSSIDWNNPANTVKSVVDAGYNVLLFAFYTSQYGPLDMATAWASLDSATKQNTVNYAHSKGAILMVSFGGDTDANFWTYDATALGNQVGNWAKSQLLDGVDFDLEGFAPYLTIGNKNSQQTIDWMVALNVATKNALGPDGFVSGAPQAPYFGPISSASNLWAGPLGGYTGIYNADPSVIDFFFIQFYNQGTNCYVDYNGLMINSGSSGCTFSGTSVNEIIGYGIPANKIIVGKPMLTSDASNGFVSSSNLNSFVKQYSQSFAVVPSFGAWQHHSFSADANWISTIYGAISGTTASKTSTTGNVPSTTAGSMTTGIQTTTGTVVTTGTISSTTGSTCQKNCTCSCNCV